MRSISATRARAQLYNLMREAKTSHEPLRITGKDGDVILLSSDDWSAIAETIYLNSVPNLVDSIHRSNKAARKTFVKAEDLKW